MLKEHCPECKREIKWQLGDDYYCVEGKQSLYEHVVVCGDMDMEMLSCPHCKHKLAVAIENKLGNDMFINDENFRITVEKLKAAIKEYVADFETPKWKHRKYYFDVFNSILKEIDVN